MLKRMLLVVFVFMFFSMFAYRAQTTAASPAADCESFDTAEVGSTPVFINFSCSAAQTAYFGVCDSGPALDDYFEIVYGGSVVATNDISGGNEIVTVGSAMTTAGSNTATLNRTLGGGTATYSYGVSTDKIAVENYLAQNCGGDYVAPTSGCNGVVALFTQDQAPSDGTLEFHMLLGNEDERVDEQIMMVWDINEGQQINNATVNNLGSPRYARVWWQPAGSSDWYLLTSQYWASGSWSTDQEYGIACGGGQPSYHTSFASAVPESDVCFDLMNGCN